MTGPKQPRTVEAATTLCERFAVIEDEIAGIEAARNVMIAEANGIADKQLLPLVEERDKIAEKIEPWWVKAKEALLTGKQKSVELGGCLIGSRKGKDKLGFTGKQEKAVEALIGLRWAKPFIRVTESVDAAATMKGLDGNHGPKLREIGFRVVPGDDVFFINRAEQGQTVGKSAK